MDQLTPEQMKDIEERVTGVIIESFGVDLSGLVLDMTNFATYLDSANTKAPIAQRGHAKQKRVDLRLIGLGLIVSTDGGIPLLSHAYPGNRADVSQFPVMVKDLVERFGRIAGDVDDLTMVYDAGQDSFSNQSLIQESPLHFVGSLPPTRHKDLLVIAKSDYVTVDEERFPGVTAYESRTTALGGEYRVILTHSENFFDKQRRSFTQTLAKAQRQLASIQAR
jgi:transposase